MSDLIVLIVFLAVAYVTGSWMEKKHYKRIRAHEEALADIPFTNDPFTAHSANVKDVRFIGGSCVIAADAFKLFLGHLRGLFGGNVAAYESLTDRARREAINRMRRKAKDADMVVNVRLQLTELGEGRVEAIAYGTAIYLDHEQVQTNPV